MNSKKVLVAVSGGVDSGAAVCLLKQQGYSVTAIMLRLHDKYTDDGKLVSDDYNSALELCKTLDVELVYADYRKEFSADVIDNFVHSYTNGLTPNPCIECNRFVKFRYVFDYADKNGFDYVATGHYAKVEKNPLTNRYELLKGDDLRKDQSYVLYNLTQAQLSRLLLPLGDFSKEHIRNIAKEAGLKNYDKADSQDICFISGDYYDFICEYLGKTFPNGNFVDKDGNVLGVHKGIIRYTYGQRKGLGLAFDSPRYVVSKNIEDNTVVLGKEDELFSDTVYAEDFNLISIKEINSPLNITAVIRYNQKPQPAVVYPPENEILKVVFENPQRAVCPGQSLVMYDDNKVLGGGKIIK